MPKKFSRKIYIPKDPTNPDIKVIHFQHDGQDKFVPLGKEVAVPDWVFDRNPAYAEFEVK